MLTGDNKSAAEYVDKMSDLNEYHAGLLPGTKLRYFKD